MWCVGWLLCCVQELGLNILALFCPKVPEGVGIGPVIEKPTEVGSSSFECVVPRGDNLDGPYYMGLVSEQVRCTAHGCASLAGCLMPFLALFGSFCLSVIIRLALA